MRGILSTIAPVSSNKKAELSVAVVRLKRSMARLTNALQCKTDLPGYSKKVQRIDFTSLALAVLRRVLRYTVGPPFEATSVPGRGSSENTASHVF